MRPWPATSTPGCSRSTSGSLAPVTRKTLTVRADLAYWTEQAESGAKSGVD